MILYNLKTDVGAATRGEASFVINKFDDDGNVESSYLLSPSTCSCPQGHKPTCRHRKMLAEMLAITDQDCYYCFDDKTFRTFDGEPTSAEGGDMPKTENPTATEVESMIANYKGAIPGDSILEEVVDEALKAAKEPIQKHETELAFRRRV